MLLGTHLECAIALIGHSHATTYKELRDALRASGLEVSQGLSPNCPTVGIGHVRNERLGGHWVVMFCGKMYDPDPDGHATDADSRVTTYLEVRV